ncbi:MAG: UvrD-helicase domain-containing protein, partial [Bacteroidota bacterium]
NIHEKQTGLIFKEYEKKLRISNAMDFDDILLNIIRLLTLSPEIKTQYQQRFSHVMVDEYQDTNRAQYIAVNLFAGGHRNLCVVGDDAQSIYRWRGADIRNILDFQKDYPEAVTVKLE